MGASMSPLNVPPMVKTGSKVFSGKKRWLWAAVGLSLLAMAAGFFRWSSADLAAARQELAVARQSLSEARQTEVQTIDQAKRAQLALGLMRDAAAVGLRHSSWAERRFNIKQANMSRAAANALLSEMVRSPDRLFGAEEFELSVRDSKEGLFSNVLDPGSTVQVSVRGSLFFRTTGDGV